MSELLAIDAGNTRIKWARFAGAEMVGSGAVAHGDAVRIFASDVPRQVIASNVAGAHVAALLHEQCRIADARLHLIVSEASRCGVTNGYRNPAQLGTDRWAALIAAHHLGPGAQLVVVAGTATTIDALAGDGQFLGGLIVPGVTLMRKALNQNTAQLGPEAGLFADFPGSTPDAIMSGAIQASAGAVERMSAVFAERLGTSPQIVLSGGAAEVIGPHLPFACTQREHLVLEGLQRIAGEVFARGGGRD